MGSIIIHEPPSLGRICGFEEVAGASEDKAFLVLGDIFDLVFVSVLCPPENNPWATGLKSFPGDSTAWPGENLVCLFIP